MTRHINPTSGRAGGAAILSFPGGRDVRENNLLTSGRQAARLGPGDLGRFIEAIVDGQDPAKAVAELPEAVSVYWTEESRFAKTDESGAARRELENVLLEFICGNPDGPVARRLARTNDARPLADWGRR